MDNCTYGPLMEEWRDIPGYEGLYQVSNYGLIKSLQRRIYSPNKLTNTTHRIVKETILKQLVTINGYRYVSLYKNSERTKPISHTLIARIFLTPVEDKTHVNHKNGIRDDNFILNFEFVSARENITHGFVIGSKRRKKSSKYVGVRWVENRNKWRATITHNKKLVNLGSFINEDDAGQAYKDALIRFGYTNKYA